MTKKTVKKAVRKGSSKSEKSTKTVKKAVGKVTKKSDDVKKKAVSKLKKSTIYQIKGSLNGKKGIFEWIVDSDPSKGVTHRRFIEGVGITGKPNARP